jgi:hypothetical protein
MLPKSTAARRAGALHAQSSAQQPLVFTLTMGIPVPLYVDCTEHCIGTCMDGAGWMSMHGKADELFSMWKQ